MNVSTSVIPRSNSIVGTKITNSIKQMFISEGETLVSHPVYIFIKLF
jgi:hypothetical protein